MASSAASSLANRAAHSVPRSVRVACAALLFVLAHAATAQQAGATLRGEVGIDTGVRTTVQSGVASAQVPLRIRARLELELPVAPTLALRATASPAIGAGPTSTEVLLRHGLQEATATWTTDDVELSAGLERWPLGEARLAPVLRLDGRIEGGDPLGLLGVRATAFLHPWRLRAGLASPTGDDLLPDRWGGAASLRLDAAAVTLETHLFATERPGTGLSASGTVGSLVAYGEAWLLADPWDARAGAGLSGYAGELLWTAEAAWAPPDGALRVPSRPALRVGGSRALGRDASLEAGAGVAGPRSSHGDGRVADVDAWVALGYDRSDATSTVRGSVRHVEGATSIGASLSVSGFF